MVTENRLVIARGGDKVKKKWGGEWAKWVMEVKSMNLSYKVNHGYVMYTMGAIVNNTVFYI